jgi:nicotinate-nucleotide adenylyltransferase
MRPIGIFGGTFDPIHYGHLRTALELKVLLDLERVHIVPCADPPHRTAPMSDGALRLRMVQAAIRDEPGFVADDRELTRAGVSYTIDTLASFRAELPGRSLCLLLGMDAFLGLPHWRRWRDLTTLAHIVVAHRPAGLRPRPGRWRVAARAARAERRWPRRPRASSTFNPSRSSRSRPPICATRCERAAIRSSWCPIESGRSSSKRSVMPNPFRKKPTRAKPKAEVSALPRKGRPKTTAAKGSKPKKGPKSLGEIVAHALDDLKADNVHVLDVRHLTTVTDTMVVASGRSDRHVRAIAGAVVEQAKKAGFRPLGVEGERSGEWVLVDLADVVVHVMLPRVREFYNLEKLWDMPAHAEDAERA